MDDDLRADLEAAIGEDDAGGEPAPAPSPVQAPAEPPGEPSAPVREPVEGDGKVRDALGRFVPKSETAEKAPGASGTVGTTVPPTQAPIAQPGASQAPVQAVPAPASWSPGAREYWGQTPAAVQQEIHRRETEMARFVEGASQARQIADRFSQTVTPFMATIRAEGVDPFTAVANLMDVTTKLRFGMPQEKAQLIADIVKAYAIDIGQLDSALAGVLPPQANGHDSQAVQQAVQQALAPLYQAAQARQQQAAQQVEGEARTELQQFAADPANEFFNDLRTIMADIVEVADRQGQAISLRDAYVRAAMLHPEVSKVILARQQGNNARQLTAAAQRAKGAAVSVKGVAPVGNPSGGEPSSIRESIEAAIEAHSRY